jgi:uncharacterized protein (TIGR02300 family)
MNTAVKLGTKRTCPKCALKFYDFGRASIHCPKCQTEVDPDAVVKTLKAAAEGKKSRPKAVLAEEEDTVAGSSIESFESVDDLDSDDDDALEDIATDTDAEDES